MGEFSYRRFLHLLGLGSAFALIILFIIFTFDVLLIIFAGIVLAIPVTWATSFLHVWLKIPRFLALILVSLLILFIAALIIIPVGPQLARQAMELITSLPASLEKLRHYLEHFSWATPLAQALKEPGSFLSPQSLDWGGLAARVPRFFARTMDLIIYPLLVVLVSLYLAANPKLYTGGFIRLFPRGKRPRIRQVMHELNFTLKWWLLGQSISMTILGVCTTSMLWLLDIPLALFLGILTAIMTFIPNIGPIIAGIPTVLISLNVDPIKALIVLVFYVILQSLEGAVITPMIHRRIIAMPPVLVIAAQIVLASLLGAIGVILAMPLVVCLMVIIHRLYIEDTLGDRDPTSPPSSPGQ